MIRWLLRKWHAYQRAADLDFLWPTCRSATNDLDVAKAAFAVHCFADPAWQELGDDGIYEVINNLK